MMLRVRIALAIAVTGLAVHAQQFKPAYFPIDTLHPAIQVDLNGDGIPDTIAQNHSFQIQELLSGGGTFTSHTIANPARGGYPIASGDFNHDGKADVIFAAPLGIAYGNGAGGFSSYKPISWSNGQAYVQAVVADFNHDGRPDLALAFDTSSGPLSFHVVVFLNNGSGFNPAKTIYNFTLPSGSTPYGPDLDLVLGDFDSDGHADLGLRTTYTDPNDPLTLISPITVFFGSGTGSFTAKTVTPGADAEYQIAAADMNNDGNSDIVGDNVLTSIFYGSHSRTFTSVETGLEFAQIQGVPMLLDLNGDGRKDIVYPFLTNDSIDNSGVISGLQTATGVFQQQDAFVVDTDAAPFSQAFVGDYNRNGRPDVMLISSRGAVHHPNSADVLFNLDRKPNGTCQVPPAPTGIAVCSPVPGATVSSPVRFAFSANSFYPIRKMEVWVDGKKRSETYEVFANQGFANVSLPLAAGTHSVALFSGGFDGTVQDLSYRIKVQ